MAVLRVLKGLNPGQIFPLTGNSIVLGRHPDCDVVLEVGAVSRQHARISREGDDYFVEDLRSRNGTYLNDNRVEGRQKLNENDQVKVCDLVFVFHRGSPEAAARINETQVFDGFTVVDDEREASSTVMSRVDVSTAATGLRIAANAEAKLKALLEIGRNLGGAVRLDEVLPKLLDNLFAIFLQADRGFVLLKDPGTGRLIPKAFKHRRDKSDEPVRISRTIVNGVMASKEAILSADAATDARFDMSESIFDFHIHSMMCAPLVASAGEVLGVIQIDSLDQRRRFTREDLEVLASVACQAAVAVENAQLHEMKLQEELMQRELAVAHKVQQGLLPAGPPSVEGYDFFDYYEPANQLGGDYFDYIPLQGNRMTIALADVSGKGISAALLMARLSAEVRYCLALCPTIGEALSRLNRVFCENRWEDRFVTIALAVVDPVQHEVRLVNAGHLTPLVRRASGEIEEIGKAITGLPIGIDEDTVYRECSTRLEPGDYLIMHTDGVPDAMNPLGEFYGLARLRKLLEKDFADSTALGERILNDVRKFVSTRPQTDDMCLTIFRRLA